MGKMKNRYMLNRKTVQHYLVDHNLTQSEFAEKLGISVSFFNEMMNGRKGVSISSLFSIAEETKMDVRILVIEVDK